MSKLFVRTLVLMLSTFLCAQYALATANFVYHEQTNNFVATPTCPSGGTDTSCGRFMENSDRSASPGMQIWSSQTYTIHFKVEFQFFTNQLRVYYTTDGSAPCGSFRAVGNVTQPNGTPCGVANTTQVVVSAYTCTYPDQTQSCQVVDVTTASIPPKVAGTTVKYIVSAWHSGGGPEIFGNSGTCGGCFSATSSSDATVFQYNLIAPTAADGTVAGRVTASDGSALAGVTVSLSGAQTRKTITDSNGSYHFANVETSGFYTVTPSRANYSFSPPARSFSQIANKTESAFAGSLNAESENPLDTAEYFVRQQYLDLLNREPDEGGFNYWSDQINLCGSDAACLRARRRDVAAAFFVEREFQDTGYFVYRLYKASFGARPSFAQYLPDRNRVTAGANLDESRHILADDFTQRAAFKEMYPDSLTNEQFVNKLYDTAGLFPYTVQRQIEIDRLSSNATRSRVLQDLIDETQFKSAEYNKAFVLTEYFSYLRRDPDAAGYEFWRDVLNNRDPNNFRGMVCSFITSAEYQRRFSAVVSHGNSECGQ